MVKGKKNPVSHKESWGFFILWKLRTLCRTAPKNSKGQIAYMTKARGIA